MKCFLLVVLFAVSSTVGAQNPAVPPAPTKTEFQYAAKFVCGRAPDAGLVAPGQYFTFVNVHNPSPDATVKFRKKFAQALPDEKAGKVTQFFPVALRADEAMGIECRNIYKHTGIPPGTFIEGYVVIHTPMELDVVTVYTAGAPNVATLHTERVPVRRVPIIQPPCANLNLSLNTGSAGWQITSDPDASTTEPRAASVITSPNFAWGTVTGANWVGPSTSGDGGVGDYTYQFCFCLCSGFTNATLTLTGLADDRATVTLNGMAVNTNNPTIPGFSGSGTQVQTSDQKLFKAGTNCVKVVVTNDMGPTGLNIAGSMTATAGRCPPGPNDPTEPIDSPKD